MKIKFFIIISFVFFAIQSSRADIIVLKDGSIHLGDIKSADKDGIVIESFGRAVRFSQQDIAKSGKSIKDLSMGPAEVVLKDGSVMKGSIQNYDNDVGLLLKTEFGVLTMPAAGIRSVHDGKQKRLYRGPFIVIGTGMGVYYPVGAFSERFKIQPTLSLFTEINAGFLRGLYFGIDTGYMFLDYRTDGAIRYDAASLRVYALYRWLDFRTYSSAARFFSPFVSIGGGIVYIARRDSRQLSFSASRKNELDAGYTVAGGVDVFATESFIIRIQASWFAVQQKSKLLNAFSTGIGFMWAF